MTRPVTPRPEPEGVLSFSVWSLPWNRRIPNRYALIAKGHNLTVTHEHDHGPTLRYHLITATGPSRHLKSCARAFDSVRRRRLGLPRLTDSRKRITEIPEVIAKKEETN